jgi:WD40 repeat protein
MRPPWPNTALRVGGRSVLAVAFSPCKSLLACSIAAQSLVHVWDRHGQQTWLEGHTEEIGCLQYSLDGRYLASGSLDSSIRLWRVRSESAGHSSSSDESMNRVSSRGTPQSQSDIILLGHRSGIAALAFSPTANLLASGCQDGEIKLWDVNNQVCIHAFNPRLAGIKVIFFAPGDTIQCYVATFRGAMIRIVRNKRMEFAFTILEEPSLGSYPRAAFSPCGTYFAAISYIRRKMSWELALFDLRTMAKTQSVILAGTMCHLFDIAMSPDGKKLATTNRSGGTRISECHDLIIQRYSVEQRLAMPPLRWPVAFDPTSRVYAVGRFDGSVELCTI